MPFTSFTCAKSNLPVSVTGTPSVHGRDLERAALFLDGGARVLEGRLDGYARFHPDGMPPLGLWEAGVVDAFAAGTAKLALRDFLADGDAFGSLGRTGFDPRRGLPYPDGVLAQAVSAGGFPTPLGLRLAARGRPVAFCLAVTPAAQERHDALLAGVRAGFEAARREGLAAAGPLPPEGFFADRLRLRADPADASGGRMDVQVRLRAGFGEAAFDADGPDAASYGRDLAAAWPLEGPRVARIGASVLEAWEAGAGPNLYRVAAPGGAVSLHHSRTLALHAAGLPVLMPWDAASAYPGVTAFLDQSRSDRPRDAAFA